MQFEIIKHHYLVHIDGHLAIVDLGSPYSFAKQERSISLGDKSHLIAADSAMIEKINKSGLIDDTKIDLLIGLDILSSHRFEFDKENGVCSVDSNASVEDLHILPVRSMKLMGQGYVLSKAKFNGKEYDFILDTGAWIGYVTADIIDGSPEIGTIEDYNPIIGEIKTTKHKVDVAIAGCNVTDYSIGLMPDILAMSLGILGVKAVMGIDDFADELVVIDMPNSRVAFR